MQRENATPAETPLETLLLALLDFREPPQPAITSTPDTTTTAIGTR